MKNLLIIINEIFNSLKIKNIKGTKYFLYLKDVIYQYNTSINALKEIDDLLIIYELKDLDNVYYDNMYAYNIFNNELELLENYKSKTYKIIERNSIFLTDNLNEIIKNIFTIKNNTNLILAAPLTESIVTDSVNYKIFDSYVNTDSFSNAHFNNVNLYLPYFIDATILENNNQYEIYNKLQISYYISINKNIFTNNDKQEIYFEYAYNLHTYINVELYNAIKNYNIINNSMNYIMLANNNFDLNEVTIYDDVISFELKTYMFINIKEIANIIKYMLIDRLISKL